MGASAVMDCPNTGPAERHQGTPGGKFVFSRIPDIYPACTFTIEKAGFVTKSLKRGEVGYHRGLDDTAKPVSIALDRAP